MKQFKKVLAFVLALAMVVTAVPTADAKAAAKAPKLNNYKKILYVGQSYTLKVNNLPANWKKCTYAWSASNKNVTVKKGKYGQAASVKANKAGTATVTVKMTYPQTAAQKKAKKKTVKTFKCVVTVKTPSVKFVTTQAEVEVGTTAQFKATAVPSNATITYASSDKAVATVDANGVVTGVADGEAVISASIKTGAKTTTAKATVKVFTAASTIKQIGAKKVEITLGKAATAETAVSVKKGAVTVSLASENGKVLSADGKTLVLTTNSNITADKYTVVVGEETLEFTGEASKVATIEIPSDKAVLNVKPKATVIDVAQDTTIEATAAYVVKNQFGEDITKATAIETSDKANVKAENGKITINKTALNGKKVTDLIAVVLINTESGITASKTFTISDISGVAEVEIKGVYQKDGKTLSEDSNLADNYYLLVAAKDQYGNAITTKKDYVNELVVSVGGLTEAYVSTNAEKITKDGVDYLGLPIQDKNKATTLKLKAGTASVIIIPTASGKTTTGSFTVADGAKVDTFDITIPDLVVADEDTEFAFTATDTYGKEITDADVLNKISTKPTGFVFEKGKDGKAKLVFKAKTYQAAQGGFDKTKDNLVAALFITNSNKVVNKTFTLKTVATAKAITGIKSDVATGALKVSGNAITIGYDKIVVEDQYGREMKTPDKNIAATTVAEGADAKFTTVSKATPAVIAKASTLTFTVDASKDAGSQEFKLQLTSDNAGSSVTENNVVKNSDYTIKLTTVDQKDIKSYEVADIGAIYTEVSSGNEGLATTADYQKEVKVNGVLANGTKVVIPEGSASDPLYSVEEGSNLTYNAGKLAAKADLAKAGAPLEKVNEITEKITVIINATAEELTKEVKISKEAPKVVSARLVDVEEVKLADGEELDLTSLTTASKYNSTAIEIKVKDQYGVEDVIKTTGPAKDARLSITEVSSDKVKVKLNGTAGATTDLAGSGLVDDTEVTATAKLTFVGGYAFTFKVKLSK